MTTATTACGSAVTMRVERQLGRELDHADSRDRATMLGREPAGDIERFKGRRFRREGYENPAVDDLAARGARVSEPCRRP